MLEGHQEKYNALFFEEARKLVASVRLLPAGSTGKEDEKVAYRSIHTLKAMSQMMGFDALTEECQKFEMALKEGRLTKEKQLEHIEKLELLVERLESPSGGASCGARVHLSIDCFDRTITLLVAIIDAVEELPVEKKRKALGNLKEICSGLLPARLVPFREIRRYLLRVVSTYQRANNRREELIFQGEDVLLDVNILTDVAGMLVHLVRNALSHGIESPEERKTRNKRAEGRIIVSAKKDRREVIIKVEDDGRGINYEMLKRFAIRKGLLTGNKKAMSGDLSELNRVLFLPGFTTREKPEEFSGFGLGLEAVKEMINSIGGIIMVSSREGSGTVFTIRIPKRNYYLKTRLFRVGERTVGIEAEPLLQVSPERKKGDHKSGRKSGKKVTIDMIRYFEGREQARFTPVDLACRGREFRILFEKELPTQEILLLEQGDTLFWKGFTKQADVVLVINMDYIVKNY